MEASMSRGPEYPYHEVRRCHELSSKNGRLGMTLEQMSIRFLTRCPNLREALAANNGGSLCLLFSST